MATATATRRHSSRRAEEAKRKETERDADSSSESEEDAQLCVVCRTKRQLVTLVCSECEHCYHLGCHSPKLTRRPKLADAWKCQACTSKTTLEEEDEESLVAVTRSSRAQKIAMEPLGTGETTEPAKNNKAKAVAAAVQAEGTSEEKKSIKRAAVKTTTSSAKGEKAAAGASKDQDDLNQDPESDAQQPIKRPRLVAATTKTNASASKIKTESRAVAAIGEPKANTKKDHESKRATVGKSKVQETKVVSKPKLAASKVKEEATAQDESSSSDEPLAKTATRVKFSAKAPIQRKPARRGKAKVESISRPAAKAKQMVKKRSYVDEDDDGDSDFVDDEEEDEVSSVSLDDENEDEDFVAKKKLPSLKNVSTNRRTSSAKSKGTTQKRAEKKQWGEDEQEPGDHPNAGGDTDEDDDEYLGPGYSVEYAANNRAKVSCIVSAIYKFLTWR